MQRRVVILDTDPALGVPRRDIDDGLALLMLLAAPAVEFAGITITFGNVPEPVGFTQAVDLLDRVGAAVPVFHGARSRHDRGRPTAAVEHLVETVRARPGEISLVAIGPLTNVATAMELDPDFAPNLRELIVMGGSLDFGIWAHLGEFNFKCDAESAARVLGDPVAKTLITLDVIAHAVFRDQHLDQLRSGGGPVARHLADEMAPWLRLNKIVFPRAKGFLPCDPVAVAALLRPELFDANPYSLAVIRSGPRAGRIACAERLGSFEPVAGHVPVDVPLALDGPAFLADLLAALLSFDGGSWSTV